MKILQIRLESSSRGVKDRIAEADRRLLKKNGHRVTYFEKDVREMNKYSLVTNSALGRGTPSGTNECSSQMRSLIQKNRPNVVHVYNAVSMNFSDIYQNCQRLGIAVIQSLHHYELLCPMSAKFYSNKLCKLCVQKSLLKEDGQKKCFRDNQIQTSDLLKTITDYWKQKVYQEKIDYYLVPNEFFREKLISFGLPDKKVLVKPDYSDNPVPESGEVEDYLLFIGKLTEDSGIRTLLKACTSLPNIPLRILGDGPLKQEVLDACSSSPNLQFLGWQSKEDCLQHLARALLLVFPTESYDVFPSTIIKSYAHGVPVIASNLGAARHLVLDGINGGLFPCGDSEVLAEKIDWLLKNPNLLTTMRERVKAEFEEKYTSEKNYQVLINLYQNALSGKKKIKEKGNGFKRRPSPYSLILK